MFGIGRQEIIDESRWEPRDWQLAFIETWAHKGTDIISPDNYRHGYLQDSEVDDWLCQRGRFEQPIQSQLGKGHGSIRLLICERLGWRPLGFAMSKRSFLAVEKAFQLPIGTIPTLNENGGRQSCQFKFPVPGSQVAESVAITVKVPQMFQLGNYGLALSHSFETGATSAFLHGWSLLTQTNHVTGAPMLSHTERIQELIKSSVSLWAHPLLIPLILLEEHKYRVESFVQQELSPKTTSLESRLGVTYSGRLAGGMPFGPADLRQLMGNEEDRISLTSLLNTTMTDSINLLGVLKWDLRYCQFLCRVQDQLQQFHPDALTSLGREIKESIEASECAITSTSEFVDAMKQRLDLQLAVLYNFVAQSESSLSSRIAAASGLDSSAMKTLAFVTTVFLPPTFVATLFSMSMFDWQASSQDSLSLDTDKKTKVVASDFWIYWAVTVPVTLVVLAGWRIWWYYQKAYYLRKYPQAKQDQ